MSAGEWIKDWVGWSEPVSRGTVAAAVKLVAIRSQPHQYIRYQPVLEHLRAGAEKGRAASVLEVGSGSLGVTRFWPHPVTGVDLCFDGADLGHLQQCNCSAAALPFPDGSFETVLSVDMLEHLEPAVREAAVREMVRVCRGTLLIGVPCAPDAQAAERWGVARCRQAAASAGSEARRAEIERRGAFLHEHEAYGLPTEAHMVDLITRSSTSVGTIEVTGNESVRAWKFLLHSLVPFRPGLVPLVRGSSLVVLPLLVRDRSGGFYRRFFTVTMRGR